jgi:hypothetical protein
MNEEDICVICLSELKGQNTYELNCKHTFHTKCIMDWFRSESSSGNCPCCMDVAPENTTGYTPLFAGFYSFQVVNHRFKNLKKFSKRKTSPELLKKEFITLKRHEDGLKDIINEEKKFKQDTGYTELARQFRKIKSKHYNKQNRIRDIKYSIVSKYPLLILT